MPAGRPKTYSKKYIKKAQEYIQLCTDGIEVLPTTEGEKPYIRYKVQMPSRGGLARHLEVNRNTLYEWAEIYPEFSDIMEAIGAIQEERLISEGLSGRYNSTISKVLLTKHGYHEKQEIELNDKRLLSDDYADTNNPTDGTPKF